MSPFHPLIHLAILPTGLSHAMSWDMPTDTVSNHHRFDWRIIVASQATRQATFFGFSSRTRE
jgi:hypothetical protein